MFRTHNDLCDVVSVLPYCESNDAFMLTWNDHCSGYWIPCKKVTSNKSWRKIAREIVDDLFFDGDVKRMCKLVRVWRPPRNGEIHHVVFFVNVSKDRQRRCMSNIYYKIVWANVEEIQGNYPTLRSPELLDFISVVKNAFLQRSTLKLDSINPEGSWRQLIDDSPLDEVVEIMEHHVFPDIIFSRHLKLLDSAEFTKPIQDGIFAQFLVHCFPCTYMNMKTFTNIFQKMGWDEKSATKLFHTADVNAMGFLSYRDFLYVLAVTEPKTQHGGVSGEIRSRYIFRHYDRNCDKVLDQGEMKSLVEDVLRGKKKSSLKNFEDVCPLMISGGSDHTINLKNFLELVGNLKLRGTSLLLRSSVNVASVFPPLREEIKFIKSVPEISAGTETLTTRLVTFFPRIPEESELQLSSERTKSGRNYAVEIHCIKLTEDGGVIDIEKMFGGSQRSLTNLSYTPREESTSSIKYTYRKAQTDMLRNLQFFAQEIGPKDSLEKSKYGVKPHFDWGSIDPSTVAQSLLKVCEGVTVVLKQEPRLLQLKPPVCALGDLRGSFPDLVHFEKCFWNLGPVLSPNTLLFLGDYVDRGSHGVEVIAYLFAHKLGSPHKIALLRGSHEIRVVQHTFYTQCIERFGESLGNEVWQAVNTAMDCLPLAAVIGGKVFCSHGGIPPPWLCPVVSTINSIPCPLSNPDEQSPLAWELLWNEPLKKSDLTESLEMELETKEGFAVNPTKGTGHLFNASALQKFLTANRLSLLLRAHEKRDVEFSSELRNMMLTLYSASPDCDDKRSSSCVLVHTKRERPFDVDQFYQKLSQMDIVTV